MWLKFFWLGVVLDPCVGSGLWWWYVDDSVSEWCARELECNLNGTIFINAGCVHSPTRPDKIPKEIKEYNNMENKIRKEVLKLHNNHRNLVAAGSKGMPKASNMRQMTWDKDLEELATRSAKGSVIHILLYRKQPLGAGACRRTQQFEQTGQISPPIKGSPSPIVLSVIDVVKQVLNQSLNNNVISSYRDERQWTFLARAVWAETYKVGCSDYSFGYVNEGGQTKKRRPDVHFRKYTCSYGPEGAIEGQAVYKEGQQCSACPEGTSCQSSSVYPNLCAKTTDPKDDDLYGGEATRSGPSLLIGLLPLILTAIYTHHTYKLHYSFKYFLTL